MSGAKIRLSQTEQEIVRDTDFILTKRSVMDKIQAMFAELQVAQHEWLNQQQGNSSLIINSPKISRGENYLGLPYLVLDYPRIFSQDDILAIRTLFWWGNYFSVTLHLSGIYKDMFAANVTGDFHNLQREDYIVSTSQDQWSHELSRANYCPLSELNPDQFKEIYRKGPFFKISKKIGLNDWDELPSKLLDGFKQAAGALITETME